MSERVQTRFAWLGSPAALLYFQIGTAVLALDAFSLAGELEGRVIGVLMYCAMSTALAFALVPELQRKRQPTRLAWIVVLPLVGFIVLKCLPTRPEPRGFQVNTATDTHKET